MKTKPGTLLVGNHLSQSGLNPSVCESLAVRLRQRGWRVLTTSQSPGRVARLWDMLTTIWNARHDYEVANVDVYSGKAFLWAEAAGHLLRIISKPYVVTLRGGNLARFARRRRRRVARLLQGAAAVTTPSRFLFEHFGPAAESVNRSRASLHLIPNPIDVGAYRYRARTAVEPHLIWVRAFHRIYNPELAVTVLGKLADKFPSAKLTMVGPDKGDGSLARTRRLAERRGLDRRVTFIGAAPKSSLPGLLDRGDIFLNTSRVDNTPVSVLEAMAAGLCIVSTDAGGMPYLLSHEGDALLTACKRPTEMTAAVKRLLSQPALAERLSRNARRNVEKYDWSTILPVWERLFFETAAVHLRQPAGAPAQRCFAHRPRFGGASDRHE